jgi:D-alanyl-D-alanine carboxypeptidase (penicillin-binding protein 5/6)
MTETTQYKSIAALAILVGMLTIAGTVSYFFGDQPQRLVEEHAITDELVSPFASLALEARAAYVYDVAEQRVIFAYNEQMQLPLASLSKLMTALVSSEVISDTEIVTIPTRALGEEGDSGLYAHERWYAKDLRDFTLLISSNDGASALALAAVEHIKETDPDPVSAKHVFVNRMNEQARALGLSQTYFINETGLDSSEYISGAYGSAQDVATLLSYIIVNEPRIIEATRLEQTEFSSLNNFRHIATNTNQSLGKIPGLIGSKTGYTELAGGNLAIAFDAGIQHPVVIVVLGSTPDGRFADVEKLVDATLAARIR